MNKNKHLIYDERRQIRDGLNASSSFKAIGRSIGRNCTTISKEVKSHRVFEKKGAPYKPFNDCQLRKRSKDNKDFCVSRNYLLTKHIKRPESYAVG